MLELVAAFPATWGLLGAAMFALPRFRACLIECGQPGGCSRLSCFAELVIACTVGAIMAAAIAPALASFLHRNAVGELRAIATILGLCANRVARDLPDAVVGWIQRFLKGSSK